jgi:UDP-N-acetylglucosamine 2-epimerase (hydrolysing)
LALGGGPHRHTKSSCSGGSILRILISIGTRPEAIKLAPVVDALNAVAGVTTRVCLTGQHPDMAQAALHQFGIDADLTLEPEVDCVTLSDRFSHFQRALASRLEHERADWIIVHGDTASTFAGAMAAFHARVPVAHVEAGLRTGDVTQPWPEEAYRKMTTVITEAHFAPTRHAERNLLAEGVDPAKISVTGNTVVDALVQMRQRIMQDAALHTRLKGWLNGVSDGKPHVLVTAHRRENHGAPMREIAEAIAALARNTPTRVFIVPVHPHPDVRTVMQLALADIDNIRLVAPLDYQDFLFAMMTAELVISDSGGVQEEAATFGVPLLILRNKTERPEALFSGTAQLVGTKGTRILEEATRILAGVRDGTQPPATVNPFGDGHAARRIARYFDRLVGSEKGFDNLAPLDPFEGPAETARLDVIGSVSQQSG